MGELAVEWAIDGEPVPLEYSSASLEAPGGYGTLDGVSVPSSALPLGAGPFSSVVGTRTDGEPFYRGEISSLPQLIDGIARFKVRGPAEALRRRKDRRLYQSQSLGGWTTADADPHAAGGYTMSDGMAAVVKDGSIVFQRHTDESFTVNDAVSVLFWAGDETITRLAFDIDRNIAHANYDMEITTAAGPTGSVSLESPDYVLSGTAVINVDKTLGTPDTQVGIRFRANASHGPTGSNTKVRVRNVRVNGRAPGDVFTLSDLAADLAGAMGWDDLSPSSPIDVLPQDWIELNWDSALTAAAEIADGTWLVLDPLAFSNAGAGLYVGPWGRRRFTVRDGDYSGVETQLPSNRAVVSYDTPAGVPQIVTAVADPDPYAALGIEVAWPEDGPFHLEGRRISGASASALADTLVAYHSAPQVRGSVHLTRLSAADGERHPWDLTPGDELTLAGYELDPRFFAGAELAPQRVVTVQRHPDGTATASVGMDVTVPALLDEATRRRRRRRRRRR